MKTVEETMGGNSVKKRFYTGKVIRFAVGASLALVLAGTAFAQYGGGGMGTGSGSTGSATPSYGSGKAIGIGVGAAAAGAGVLYLALHHGPSVTGCVQSRNDGLILVDDKMKSYRLLPGGADLLPGERVEIKGRKSHAGATVQTFQPKKLVKNLGACSTPSATSDNLSRPASAISAHDFPSR